MKLEYIATDLDNYKTIKDILLSHFHISHRLLVTLKREHAIFLNGIPTFIYQTIKQGDCICISFTYSEDNSNIVSQQMPLDIIYEDDGYMVINKPAGIAMHPSILHYENSLSSAVKFYFDSIGLQKKIRPVNRLDKDTSGLVLFAKNEYIQEAITTQMQTGHVKKEYLAIVEGWFDSSSKKRNH